MLLLLLLLLLLFCCRPTHLLEVNALSGQSNSSCSALRPRGGTHEACTRTSAWRGTSGKTTRILAESGSKQIRAEKCNKAHSQRTPLLVLGIPPRVSTEITPTPALRLPFVDFRTHGSALAPNRRDVPHHATAPRRVRSERTSAALRTTYLGFWV